jgi:hypothetical protein
VIARIKDREHCGTTVLMPRWIIEGADVSAGIFQCNEGEMLPFTHAAQKAKKEKQQPQNIYFDIA